MDKFLEFAGNNTVLVVLLMISFFVLIFSELRRKASGLINVDPTGAVSLINQDAVVVDLLPDLVGPAQGHGHVEGGAASGTPVELHSSQLGPTRQAGGVVGVDKGQEHGGGAEDLTSRAYCPNIMVISAGQGS